mmetsp:Transcript_4640/g.7871  ORF Transcript_4640/g.7871 Transcript_4640/m.7871 type:complete len:95 (+) Transcript_4640:13-297(+)
MDALYRPRPKINNLVAQPSAHSHLPSPSPFQDFSQDTSLHRDPRDYSQPDSGNIVNIEGQHVFQVNQFQYGLTASGQAKGRESEHMYSDSNLQD